MPLSAAIPQGARARLIEIQDVTMDEVNQDCEEEVESLAISLDIDNRTQLAEAEGRTYLQAPASTSTEKRPKLDFNVIKDNLKKASEHVVVENTLNEYRRCALSGTHRASHVFTKLTDAGINFRRFVLSSASYKRRMY